MGSGCSKGTEQEQEPEQIEGSKKTNSLSKTSSSTTKTENSGTYKLKIVLLGDIGVGKTSLLHQFGNKKLNNKPTPEFNGVTKQLTIGDKIVVLEILDTKGQEDPGGRGLEAAFFENAKGCILVYDVTNPGSRDNLKNWHNQLITRVISSQSDGKSFPFVVLGNKCDLDAGKNSKELFETIEQWCQDNGQIRHVFTSAKENKRVDEAFQYIAQLSLNKVISRSNNLDSTSKDVPKPSLQEGEQPKPTYQNNNVRGSQGLVPEYQQSKPPYQNDNNVKP